MSFAEKFKGGLHSAKKFIIDVWHELKKVRWPNRKELKGYTTVVLGVVAAITLYFYAFDLILKNVLDLFF